MSAASVAPSPPAPPSPDGGAGSLCAPLKPAEVDASCRGPVLFAWVLASLWLLPAGWFGVLAAIKLHAPGFLADCPWLTYGRVQPLAWHAFVFGFVSQAGFGLAAWITARLGRTRLVAPTLMVLGTGFWNLALVAGLIAVAAGHGSGLEGLEFPAVVYGLLLAAYLVLASGLVVTFHHRRESEVHPAQWYTLGALFCFPWLIGAASQLGIANPLRGVLQAAVQAWFVHGLLTLWLGFLSLGALFYLIPKLKSTPVTNRNLAVFGFWTLALFGSLGGLARFATGPFPSWMISLSIVGVVLTLFPLVTIGMNLVPVLRAEGARRTVPEDSVVLRWAGMALVALLLAGTLLAASTWPALRRITPFTLYPIAIDQLMLFGLAAPACFAIIYHAVPSLARRPWPSLGLLRLHFVLVLTAVALMTVAFLVGGVRQGLAMADAELPFILVVKRYLPFASMGTLAQLIFWLGSVAFGLHLLRLLSAGSLAACHRTWRTWTASAGKEGRR